MRQNEIAQLHLDDIRQVDGVWVFDINDNTPDKRLKTINSKRLVPLHPFLSNDLNLPGHVARLKEQGEERLFPEISESKTKGYAPRVSGWFNGNYTNTEGYRGKVGIAKVDENGARKHFHSFRHTLINHLKQKLVKTEVLHELDGHVNPSLSMSRYGKQYNPHIMLEETIKKIDFHESVGLEHLRGSKWAGNSDQ